MSRHPNRYRGAYDYNYTYGDYDFVDRGAWSSPEHAYDEYDPRAGRATRTSPTNSQVQSAYADYYTEPRDCYSAPSSSQTDASYNRTEGQQWRQDPGSAYQEPRNYEQNADHTNDSRTRPRSKRRGFSSTAPTATAPRLIGHGPPARAYSTALHNAEPFTIRPVFGKPRSPTPPPPPPRLPEAEYLAVSLQPSTSLSPTPLSSARKLLVLDLNGTLLIRPGRVALPRAQYGTTIIDPSLRFRPVHPRPYMSTFRAYLFDERTRSWLDTMVWSSAQPHSVDDMVSSCFDSKAEVADDGDEGRQLSAGQRGRDNLVAVWARDTLGLSDTDYHRKSQTLKDLAKPWAQIPTGTGEPHSARTTLLLDDSPLKAQLQPYNHICIPEYGSALRGVDLETLASEQRLLDPTAEGGKKRKRKSKKRAAEESRRRLQGQDEDESGTSVSSADAIPLSLRSEEVVDVAGAATQTQPAGTYDETLLAVIGVLDNVRSQSNVAGWVRAGGLWGPNSSPPAQSGPSSGNDAAAGEAEAAVWFNNHVNFEYWARRGRTVAESMGIPVLHGIVG